MTLLLIFFIVTITIVSYVVGLRHGEKETGENLLAQLYSLSHFLDGEAKITSDEIFNNLDKLGFIDEAFIKDIINNYRKIEGI
jgi:hypothetical protein